MFTDLFFYFFLASLVFAILSGIFFSIQKKKMITRYQQPNSKVVRSISGTIVTKNGFLRKKYEWCSFDILINANSIFLFPKTFYCIPTRFINLIFSNSDKRNTKRPTILREFYISKHSVELVSYPGYLINGERKIYLKNLNQEQIILFQNVLKKNS